LVFFRFLFYLRLLLTIIIIFKRNVGIPLNVFPKAANPLQNFNADLSANGPTRNLSNFKGPIKIP